MQNIEPQAEIELEGAEAAQMLTPYGIGIDTRSKFQNTADAGIGTETERRFLIGLNCDWTVKADLEIGAPVSPFNPARPFYPHYHRCSDIKAILVTTNRKEKEWKAWKRTDGRVYQQHQERFHAGTGHHRSQMCNSVTMCNGSKSHKPFSINNCNGVTGVPHLSWLHR